jgi:hypothetical protein
LNFVSPSSETRSIVLPTGSQLIGYGLGGTASVILYNLGIDAALSRYDARIPRLSDLYRLPKSVTNHPTI